MMVLVIGYLFYIASSCHMIEQGENMIQYDASNRLFHLSTEQTSYIFKVHDTGHLVNLHYGARVRQTGMLNELYQNYKAPVGSATAYNTVSHLTLDTLMHEAPAYGKGDYRVPMILLEDFQGSSVSDFVYVRHQMHKGEVSPEGLPHVRKATDTLEITLKETTSDLYLMLYYVILEASNCITRFARIENRTEHVVKIQALMSFSLDLMDSSYEAITLDGTWIRERHINEGGIRPGIFSIDSKKGVSGANHNPFIGLKGLQTDEHQGDAYGFSLIYSGNFLGRVEVSPFGMTRVQMGVSDFDFCWQLEPQAVFETPQCVLTYTNKGLNALSQNFHHLVNHHIIPPYWQGKERPILINNWEATYFDFDERKLLKLAKEAKNLGIELFVLDDGWFKGRNDDTTSLGDWIEDPKKLPNGLEGLSQRIRALGLQFGIWVEPEMVSMKSALYKQHPEWAVQLPNREPSLGRNQLVLDYANPEVIDAMFNQLHRVFQRSRVSYVKWDMNRNFSDLYSNYLSASMQRTFNHRYVLGLYKLLEKLTEAFPEVLFESCSSGGNRFDLGMLFYMPQTWTSDNTDAVERMDIQYGTSLVYPPSTMGAHVSGRPSHQVLRSTPIETRFNVAAFGVLGYELDLTKCSPFDKKVIKKQIDFYKNHRKNLQFGRFYRHASPFKQNIFSWSVVDDDGKAFILGYYQKLQKPCVGLERIKLRGLNDDETYSVYTREQYHNIAVFGELINPYIPITLKEGGIIQNLINNRYLYPLERQTFSQNGDVLMHIGLALYAQFTGTGVNEETRYIGDFGSRLYIGHVIEDQVKKTIEIGE